MLTFNRRFGSDSSFVHCIIIIFITSPIQELFTSLFLFLAIVRFSPPLSIFVNNKKYSTETIESSNFDAILTTSF